MILGKSRKFKRHVPRVVPFKVIIYMLELRTSCMLLTLSFFFLQKFFFTFIQFKEDTFCTKIMQKKKYIFIYIYIYIYVCIGRRARSRAKDHRTSFPDP